MTNEKCWKDDGSDTRVKQGATINGVIEKHQRKSDSQKNVVFYCKVVSFLSEPEDQVNEEKDNAYSEKYIPKSHKSVVSLGVAFPNNKIKGMEKILVLVFWKFDSQQISTRL